LAHPPLPRTPSFIIPIKASFRLRASGMMDPPNREVVISSVLTAYIGVKIDEGSVRINPASFFLNEPSIQ